MQYAAPWTPYLAHIEPLTLTAGYIDEVPQLESPDHQGRNKTDLDEYEKMVTVAKF